MTVGSYWVNDYRKQPVCAVHGYEQTKYCDDVADGFAGAMRAGGHRVTVRLAEGAASPRHWTRETDSAPGGVDTVDFAFLATHGGTHGFELRGGKWVHWVDATFNSPDGCVVASAVLPPREEGEDQEPPSARMQLGDGRLRWLVLDLCEGLQVRLINHEFRRPGETERAAIDRRAVRAEAFPSHTWTRCFAGIHMMFGFTGLSSDASWTSDRGAAFGLRAGGGEPLAEAWLDEAHSSPWLGNIDDAPVAMAWGRSEADAMRRLKGESLADPEDTLAPADVGGAAVCWRS
ncbi:DUF6345 domain-containing protein [Agromyces sp. ZXT2-6]|uniref:DUF6345 domain-containing protein n=1 Tax=Agromyces sp. ZXT2-6 TaxID=3461153 RepID=UPI0040550B4A